MSLPNGHQCYSILNCKKKYQYSVSFLYNANKIERNAGNYEHYHHILLLSILYNNNVQHHRHLNQNRNIFDNSCLFFLLIHLDLHLLFLIYPFHSNQIHYVVQHIFFFYIHLVRIQKYHHLIK